MNGAEQVETADGWLLGLSRFRPRPGHRTVGPPFLLVHGLSQSATTWTVGRLAHRLRDNGAEVFLLDLRGHGSSSTEAQRRAGRTPSDLDFDWDVDAFLYRDLPAAVDRSMELSGARQLLLCGHSMGGCLALAHALDDKRIPAVAALSAPLLPGTAKLRVRMAAGLAVGLDQLERLLPLSLFPRRVPMDLFFKAMDAALHPWPMGSGALVRWLDRLDRHQVLIPRLWNSSSTKDEAARETLRGCEPEAWGVLAQIAGWVARGRVSSLAPVRDLSAEFTRFDRPMLLLTGGEDLMAPPSGLRRFKGMMRTPRLRTVSLRRANHICVTAGSHAAFVAELLLDLRSSLAAE